MAEKNSKPDDQKKESPRTPEKLPSPRFQYVSASPPKNVNLEDLMKLRNGVTDFSLAHEIAIDSNFKFHHNPPPNDTLEGQVREVMHKAFWDVLEADLKEDPPNYGQALTLLKEMKEGLLELLMPQSQSRLRANIDEVLDLELIEQKAAHDVLDFQYYANYVIELMATLCAPVRDEQVARLKQISDVVPLYKEIFSVLNLLKLDMVNFTLAQVRPFLQQHSVEYEKDKFSQLLKTQQENGVDGLQFTKAWIARNAAMLAEKQKLAGGNPGQASSSSSDAAPSSAASVGAAALLERHQANAILNASYLELLEWDEEHQVYPETLLVDHQRLNDMRHKFGQLAFTSTILALTYGTVGPTITDIADLKLKLKNHIQILTESVTASDLSDVTANIAEQVIKEVNECLTGRGKDALAPDKEQLLRRQITSAVAVTDNAVFKLMKSRLIAFIGGIVANPQSKDFQIPPGYSAVSDELSQVSGQFLRLIAYNQMVFGKFYDEIIDEILLQQQNIAAATENS